MTIQHRGSTATAKPPFWEHQDSEQAGVGFDHDGQPIGAGASLLVIEGARSETGTGICFGNPRSTVQKGRVQQSR